MRKQRAADRGQEKGRSPLNCSEQRRAYADPKKAREKRTAGRDAEKARLTGEDGFYARRWRSIRSGPSYVHPRISPLRVLLPYFLTQNEGRAKITNATATCPNLRRAHRCIHSVIRRGRFLFVASIADACVSNAAFGSCRA